MIPNLEKIKLKKVHFCPQSPRRKSGEVTSCGVDTCLLKSFDLEECSKHYKEVLKQILYDIILKIEKNIEYGEKYIINIPIDANYDKCIGFKKVTNKRGKIEYRILDRRVIPFKYIKEDPPELVDSYCIMQDKTLKYHLYYTNFDEVKIEDKQLIDIYMSEIKEFSKITDFVQYLKNISMENNIFD